MATDPATRNIESPSISSKTGNGLLSVKQAAAYLNMSAAWLYGSGIRFARIGRRRLYRRNDLDDFIDRHLLPKEHGQ